MLGYLQNLVEKKYVKDVIFYNLPVGHTHFEVDQAIGTDKRFLFRRNLNTFPQMLEKLNGRGNRHYQAFDLGTVRDWRTEIARHYGTLTGISTFCMFNIQTNGIHCRRGYTGTYQSPVNIRIDESAVVPSLAPGAALETTIEDVPFDVIKSKMTNEHLAWWCTIENAGPPGQSQIDNSMGRGTLEGRDEEDQDLSTIIEFQQRLVGDENQDSIDDSHEVQQPDEFNINVGDAPLATQTVNQEERGQGTKRKRSKACDACSRAHRCCNGKHVKCAKHSQADDDLRGPPLLIGGGGGGGPPLLGGGGGGGAFMLGGGGGGALVGEGVTGVDASL